MQVNDQSRDDDMLVHSLYKKLLKSWNQHNVEEYANLFTIDANVFGFDGNQMNGRVGINNQISEIFSSHNVSSYVSIIREIRPLCPTVFLLRAAAGNGFTGTLRNQPGS